jgi:signal transduction histidine kinase
VLDGLPIRARIAGVSALLTFAILCAFAIGIGSLTVHRIRTDFDREVTDSALRVPWRIAVPPVTIQPALPDVASSGSHVVIKVFTFGGRLLAQEPATAPSLGRLRFQATTVYGYRVVTRVVPVHLALGATDQLVSQVIVQYARPISDTEATIGRVELFLVLGVFAGTALALLAGMAIARRAMAPITSLTAATAEIARTRDSSRRVPQSKADDEVAELARTLDGMLRELDTARGETESMLARQRQFVADASHELRTPLTSVLANLELLAEGLHGDQGEAALSALRSSRRMRRLVADLLMLARKDIVPVVSPEPCDLAQIAAEAAAELSPISDRHNIVVDLRPAVVEGSRDELLRLTINLLENAVRHTPPGTDVLVFTGITDGQAELVVQDNGPGVPPELVPTLFERFVRGGGDRGGSFGLGLAVVRAVVESHGGSVSVEPTSGSGGARFVVRVPSRRQTDVDVLTPATN